MAEVVTDIYNSSTSLGRVIRYGVLSAIV